MTTADGTAIPPEQQSTEPDEARPLHMVRDADTRAIPIVDHPSAPEVAAPIEESPRPDLFDTVVLPVVPPRPLPGAMARREIQRPNGARSPHDDRRASAPVALRATVVVLLLLFLATSGAFVAVHARPSAFDALRETYVVPEPNLPAATPRVPERATHASLVSTTSSAVTYSVPTSSYSIVVTITHPCWLVVHSPASSPATLVSKTIEPTLSPLTVPVHGSASITIAARATSLSIISGSTVLDTVDNPRLGVAYTFLPATS